MSKIEVHDLQALDNLDSDSGSWGFKICCPKCSGIIYLIEAGWGDRTCNCGYMWSMELKAVGKKDEENNEYEYQWCAGSGEGQHYGSSCPACNGKGVAK